MNRSIIGILALFGWFILANPSIGLAAETAQMDMLNKSWEVARARAALPADEAYVRELDKLLDTFTKNSQLEDAIAVKAEKQSVIENASGAASTNPGTAKKPTQVEPLRKTWILSREKAIQPSKAIYVRELQKLQATYTKAGQLEEALAVKQELENLDTSSGLGGNAATASKQSKSFVGKKWSTASGTRFTFKADGTGIQANAAGKEWPLAWTQDKDGMLTVEGWFDDQKKTLYFRFTNSKEVSFGVTSQTLDRKLSVK